ncbi:MAG: hypothetical protein SFV23_09445, partial [Planctomycetaceae bacterium]|nr:hypothetical protein [Planctomycetaceae bacterium]
DMSDATFLASRPSEDAALLLEVRNAIARFLDVPHVKVHRDLRLFDDLHIDKLSPAFHFYVVDSVLATRKVIPQRFGLSVTGLNSIDDLSQAILELEYSEDF